VPFASGLLRVGPDGRLVVDREPLPVRALPDARPVVSEGGTAAVFADPTDRYPHGVLGDELEAGSIAVVRPDGGVRRLLPRSGGVFEGLAPVWFREGKRDLLAVTESAAGVGSRISIYDPRDGLVAAGPPIGEGEKWRHLLSVGPFGPDGETEIAVTRTPHLTPVVEFYRPNLRDGTLELVLAAPGLPTHEIGSRNLETVTAGDLDGDGRAELLLPYREANALVALRHTRSGVEVAWQLPLGGPLSTNLAPATDRSGRIAIAAGTADGRLLVWR
jgi:hypothetical protein